MTGLLAALLSLSSGCAVFVVGAVAGAGVGGYAWVRGEARVTEGASLDRSWTATLAAMQELQYPITKQGKDTIAGELTAVNGSGKKVNIYLKRASTTATEISVRVGTFGDEALSRTILMKIEKHLGTS